MPVARTAVKGCAVSCMTLAHRFRNQRFYIRRFQSFARVAKHLLSQAVGHEYLSVSIADDDAQRCGLEQLQQCNAVLTELIPTSHASASPPSFAGSSITDWKSL